MKVKIKETVTTEVNGNSIKIFRKSKYTMVAMDMDGAQLASGSSWPKLIGKLEKMFPSNQNKRVSMRSRVIELMNSGEVNSDITTTINAEFPKTKYDKNHTSWYRSNLISLELVSQDYSAAKMKLKLEK